MPNPLGFKDKAKIARRQAAPPLKELGSFHERNHLEGYRANPKTRYSDEEARRLRKRAEIADKKASFYKATLESYDKNPVRFHLGFMASLGTFPISIGTYLAHHFSSQVGSGDMPLKFLAYEMFLGVAVISTLMVSSMLDLVFELPQAFKRSLSANAVFWKDRSESHKAELSDMAG